jgi:hypothetical protein
MAKFKVLSWHLPGENEENHENLRIASLWADIKTWDLPITKQEC